MSRTIQQCADIVSLTVPTLKLYVKKGMPVESDGTFDISKVVSWIAENSTAQQHTGRKSDAKKAKEAVNKFKELPPQNNRDQEPLDTLDSDLPMTMTEAKTRKEIAQALQAELNLAKEMEQVANIDDLMEEFSSALVTVRASLSSMSSRLAGILAHQDEQAVRKLIDEEVTVMLTGLSNYDR